MGMRRQKQEAAICCKGQTTQRAEQYETLFFRRLTSLVFKSREDLGSQETKPMATQRKRVADFFLPRSVKLMGAPAPAPPPPHPHPHPHPYTRSPF